MRSPSRRARRDRDRSGRHLGHARGRAHHGDAGPPRRRHRVARRAGAALAGRQQPAASSVVAPRAVSSRAARIRRGARALRQALPQSRQPADAGAARPLHRRAERRLDAVPPRAARHRCRRPLERDRRQGRGAHRRLPLGLHAAALDDGARGDRARRGGAAHARRACARSARARARCSASSAMSRCRSAKPSRRTGAAIIARALDLHAAGARRHAPARRQPCAAGRADAALPRQRAESRLRRRRAPRTWIMPRPRAVST